MLLSATSRQTASADLSVLKASSHVQLKLSRCYKLLLTPVTSVELRLISRYKTAFTGKLSSFRVFRVFQCFSAAGCVRGQQEGYVVFTAEVLPEQF